MPDAPLLPSGDDYFGLGADQFTTAQKIATGKFVSSENTLCRGGVVQTRPGSRSLITLPQGNLQGATLFKPASGIPHIVAAVDGAIYVSPYPFTEIRQLTTLQFGISSKYIAWSICLKSTDFDSTGTLFFLDNPYSVLVIQDGVTRAGYWDGTTAAHLDPTPSPNPSIPIQNHDGTPIGLWMYWANNRLWVSRGNQIFASDIGNPLKFTEAQYLNEGRAFYLPELCTGIAATTDQQGIVCFTEQTGTFFESSIQDRTQWLSTPAFQKTILPSVGCVAPRSIVAQYGLLYWYSSRGLINQDDALRANITSRVNVQDNPMFATKANMSFNLSGICGAAYENMLLQSVPYGSKLNTRTMVLDQNPSGETNTQVFSIPTSAWASYWTGWQPVEWAYGVVNGEERIFFASIDYDGQNRIWEVGTHDKTDNGVPITCNLMTREHLFGNRDGKILDYVEAELSDLVGDVSFMISVAGVRGGWQVVGEKEIAATQGQIYGDQLYGEGANLIAGASDQIRVIKSQNYNSPNECNSVCVESDRNSGMIDKAFSLMFSWSGAAGIYAYRIFARPDANFYQGSCEDNEQDPRLINDEGCGAISYFSTSSPFTTYTSTKTFSQKSQETSLPVSYTATQTSIISQHDADNKALAAATSYVETILGLE